MFKTFAHPRHASPGDRVCIMLKKSTLAKPLLPLLAFWRSKVFNLQASGKNFTRLSRLEHHRLRRKRSLGIMNPKAGRNIQF